MSHIGFRCVMTWAATSLTRRVKAASVCRLAAKFVRLFIGVHVILIPDRDRAGEEGAESSIRALYGVGCVGPCSSSSIRVQTDQRR